MGELEDFRSTIDRLTGPTGTRPNITSTDIGYHLEGLLREGKTQPRQGAGRSSYNHHYARNADSTPSVTLLIEVAKFLGVDPEEFVEYRLAVARSLFDPRPPDKGGVGLRKAAANLQLLEQVLSDDDPVLTVDPLGGMAAADADRPASHTARRSLRRQLASVRKRSRKRPGGE